MEPTSEQELKELLDDGKISEEEYQQLLEALHKKQAAEPEPSFRQPVSTKSPAKYGKTALILLIAAVLLPFVGIALALIFHLTGIWLGRWLLLPLLFLGMLCGIVAFIFGIIGWKSPAGKIAALGVPCLGFLVVFILPVIYLFGARVAYVPSPIETDPRHLESNKAYPLDSLDGILTQDASLDEQISFDGNGSLRLHTNSADKTVFRLFETGPMGIEDKMLFYSAKLKSQLQEGKAYLEMWCDVPGFGESFSRSLENPVTGQTEWTNVQTPFRLETGQMPANIKLNLVIEGLGTVWIDDIKILSSPLN